MPSRHAVSNPIALYEYLGDMDLRQVADAVIHRLPIDKQDEWKLKYVLVILRAEDLDVDDPRRIPFIRKEFAEIAMEAESHMVQHQLTAAYGNSMINR